MKWIKYKIEQSVINEQPILIDKKIGYSETNLAIALEEAYNGEYEIEEDDSEFESEPLPIELGGTGEKSLEELQKKLGVEDLSSKYTRFLQGSYDGNGNYGISNRNSIPVPFPPKVMIISRGNGTPFSLFETSVIHFFKNEEDEDYYVANIEDIRTSDFPHFSKLEEMYYENGFIEWYTDTPNFYQYKANLETGWVSKELKEYTNTDESKIKAAAAGRQLNSSHSKYCYLILG